MGHGPDSLLGQGRVQPPAPSQWPVLQGVLMGAGVAVALQAGPAEQVSDPTKQSLGGAGVQVAPTVHARQLPPEQTSFVPQVVPFGSAAQETQLFARQKRPVPQVVPSAWPEQEIQLPAEQKRPVPQVVPLAPALGVKESTQTDVPDAQEVVPESQIFVGGAQARFAVQATHAPPEQTWFVPQEVPFCKLVPVSAQVEVPVLHVVVPV